MNYLSLIINSNLFFVLFILTTHSCIGQTAQAEQKDSDRQYFGQKVPGSTPQIFAPGNISVEGRYEFGSTLSKDGKEFFYGVDDNGHNKIYYTLLTEKGWSEHHLLYPGDTFGHNDPMLSPNEDRLYFISNRPIEKDGKSKDIDIWYAERTNDGWSQPKNPGPPVNNNLNQYFASFTQEGHLYYGSKDKSPDAPGYAFDIYKADWVDGAFANATKLPETINTHRYEADVFIAPDESYMIFCSIRRDGLGDGDLYLSWKNEADEWVDAINIGAPVNTPGHELCPFVTPDGKYLMYTSNKDIWWVSMELIYNLMKNQIRKG